MAGDWIKLQHVTPDKPEIYKLASILRVSPEDALGRCVRLWVWADQQSLDGHAITVTIVTLDAVTRCDGFGTALLKTGWVVQNEDGSITLPNFDRHNGETAKTRALSSNRKKKQRLSELENHAEVTEKSRALRDKSVTREEKRREEVNIDSRFEQFWSVYPVRKGKQSAIKAWDKAKINGEFQQVLDAVEAQKNSDQWKKGYIPYPAKWISDKRWLDELEPVSQQSGIGSYI